MLSGCQSKEARNADALIKAIGQVSLESEELIVNAEDAVAALTDEDKASLSRTEELTKAWEQYNLLVKVKQVETLIDNIKFPITNESGI